MGALHLDLETCSTVNLKEVGAHVYARHPSTQVICASYAFNNLPVANTDFRTQLGGLARVDRLIREGATVHGWNVAFERLIWNHVVAPKMGFDPIFPDQTVCTMATGACFGLPLKLETAAKVIGSPHLKNTDGHGVMLRMARPRRVAPLVWWHETDAGKLPELIAYNRDDVEAERAISNLLPRMGYFERRVWLADQRMADRGMPVDTEFLAEAFRITTDEMSRLSRSLDQVTGGEVTSVNQVGRLTKWLQTQGYPSGFGVGKEDIETVLRLPINLTPLARQALSIRQEAAKSSTAKLSAIDQFAPMAERARGLIQYGGAVRTLRWAGRGPQLQNFPRPSIKHAGIAANAIAQGLDVDCLREIFGPPLEVISSCLRGAFKAPTGKRLVVCDFSGIEARVLAWLAGDRRALDLFRAGEDIYLATAQSIGSNNRQLGKVLVLACGYGMGAGRFLETANAPPYSLGLTPQQAELAVYAWRDANPDITVYWRASEDAFRSVLANENKTFYATVEGINGHPAPPVRYRRAKHKGLKGAILIELPSGRHLVYRGATLGQGRFGGGERILYEGNDFNHNWGPIETYGGKICLAGGTLVLTERGWLRLDGITNERVWDGESFVSHGGLIAKGRRQVIDLDGVRLTPNHKVLTARGWRYAALCEGFDPAPVALPDRDCGHRFKWKAETVARPLRLRRGEDHGSSRVHQGQSEVLRVHEAGADWRRQSQARHEPPSSLRGLAVDARSLSFADASGVAKLWGPRDHSLSGMDELRSVLGRYGTDLPTGVDDRTRGQHGRILGGELCLGDIQDAGQQSTQQVYDIVDAGPRRRFVVAGLNGPLLVHNCENITQAVARDLLACALIDLSDTHDDELLATVHDEIIGLAHEQDAQTLYDDMRAVMQTAPPWAKGLPLAAAGFIGERYGK